MYDINDETPIGVLTVGQFKSLMREIIREFAKNSNSKTVNQPQEVMDITKLSEYTGLSKSHIYKLTSSFKIPHYKNGKRLYFKCEEINDWLTQNRMKTMDEITDEALNFQLKSS